jgi:phosphatidylserine decarboxylase
MIANDLRPDTQIPTKGTMTLSLSRLLDHSQYSDKFVGATALAALLMPDNYHHYHAPAYGVVVESKMSAGDCLFGMLDMSNEGSPGYGKDYSVIQDFRHGYFIIETDDFGFAAMVPIGLQGQRIGKMRN